MARRTPDTTRRHLRRTNEIRRAIATDLRRLRLDAGLTLARVADAAGMSRSHLNEIELARVDPSLPVLVALSDVLGVDLAIGLFPSTGPRIRDHIQAQIGEELLRLAHPVWRRLVEVPVHSPARGIVDLVLHHVEVAVVVATEIHSQLRRLEQQMGWAQLKAESLPSAEFWRFVDPPPSTSRLLVLRSTKATRDLAIRFEDTMRVAYPAPAGAVHAALVSNEPWPGPGLLWANVDDGRVRILDRPPRNVRLGR